MTHQCTICLKSFGFVSKLRRHQLSHSGQRPFTCYICLKSFRQSSHLKGHLKSHSKLREVSLILSQTISSQISYTNTEESYKKHFGVEISEEGEPADEDTWYTPLHTHDQREYHQTNDVVKQHLISDDGQTCDVTRGNYDGFEGLVHDESPQDRQYSEYDKIPPDSANDRVEKQEHPGAEDAQKTELKTSKSTNRHQCSVCLKCFSAPSKLKRHLLIHSIFRPFCCEFCPKAFRQLAHLKMHLSTHFSQRCRKTREAVHGRNISQNHPLDTLVCTASSVKRCTADAGGIEKVPKGLDNVHMESFPENIKCVKRFNTSETTWTESKVGHECPVCRKCFSAPSKLRRHCLIHTGQKPFQCSLCCRAFRQLSHLKAHHSVHAAPTKKLTSALQMHRSTQPQPSTSKARLRRFVHISLARKFRSAKQKLLSLSPAAGIMIEENNSQPGAARSSSDRDINGRQDHSCSVCSKHFNAPSKLRRHILIHTGQRPFRCSLCFRGFRQKSHLKAHKCKGGSMFQSSISEVQLRDPETPDSRSNSIGTENKIAEENFISISRTGDSYVCSLNTGIDSTATPEDSTDLTSLSCKDLSRPLEEANQSKGSGYQCTVCFKIFDFPSKLSRHLLIHMNIKPFKCSVCSKTFRQLCHLQNHSKVHAGRRKALCQGTLKNRIGASIPGNLPVSQRPDTYCGKQKMFINSAHHSVNLEEFTPNVQSTSSPVKVHEGEGSCSQMKRNPNQCIFCLKTFDFPSKLSRHLLVHTGIRPYECHVCCKSFKQLSHLQCHQWLHNKNHNSELNASIANHQNPIFTGRTTLTDEPDLHQESCERLALVNQGQDGYTVQVHNQKGVSLDNKYCPSGSGHDESKIKSETDLLVDMSVCPNLKHDSDPFDADRTSSMILYKCPPQQAEKCESEDFKVCSKRAGEALGYTADRTTRIPVCDSMDQQEMVETGDPGPFSQKIDRTSLHSFPFFIPEESFPRSLAVPDSCKLDLNRHHQDSRQDEGHNQHLTEPPNDLPICPSCSQCFDSLQDLNAHNCPVNCPTQRLSKSYQCAVCFKNFEAPSKLKRHYVIHTGQRPYCCNVCGKDFTQSSHLKTHMMSHR